MEYIEQKDFRLINSRIPCDMFNIIAPLNIRFKTEFNELINKFTFVNLPFALWTGFSSQITPMQPLLADINLPAVEQEVGMYADTATINPDKLNSKLVIKPVADSRHISDLIEVISTLVVADQVAIDQYFSRVKSQLIESGKLTFFVGYLDNKPVATASIYRDQHSAGIWDIIALPAVRRQGIGTTMTYFVAMQARQEGYRRVVLTASDEGLPVYQKMGFNKTGCFQVYNFSAKG
jgi:ribosomal protein S18 acetylase RimI-like enzyme